MSDPTKVICKGCQLPIAWEDGNDRWVHEKGFGALCPTLLTYAEPDEGSEDTTIKRLLSLVDALRKENRLLRERHQKILEAIAPLSVYEKMRE